MNLLRIDSSARSNLVSRFLTDRFTELFRKANPDAEVRERDLCSTRMPNITDDWSATFGASVELTDAQKEYLSISDALIAELFAADLVVIGSPMYNLTISWPLKAWIDQVVRVGKTMTYGTNGPKGLLGGRRVVVITSKGGAYSPEPSARDFGFQQAYLRRVLGAIGLNDVVFIHANHQRPGPAATPAQEEALKRIEQIVMQIGGKGR